MKFDHVSPAWRAGILATFAVLLAGASYAQQAQRPADQFFDSDGVQIRYVEAGEGEPLLLIHGFSVNTEFQWGSNLNKLAEDFHVVAMDVRGHGKSGKPHGAENYGQAIIEDAVRLLDHLGIEKAHVMGYSMGGAITLNLVANHPERVKSAIVGGNGWAQPGEDMDTLIETIAAGLENGQGIKPLILALTPPGQEPMPEPQLEQMNAMAMAANDPLALASVARGFADFAIPAEKLAANQVPTTIIIGTADPMKRLVPPAVEVMANLQVVELEGDNHMTAARNPDYYTAAVAFFGGDDPNQVLMASKEAASAEAEGQPAMAGR